MAHDMEPTVTFVLVEDRIGEPLAPLLLRLRSEGLSFGLIAHELSNRADFILTGETVRRWSQAITANQEAAS